jgi:hypothetical protein
VAKYGRLVEPGAVIAVALGIVFGIALLVYAMLAYSAQI